jgi:hypothetical protein
MAGKKPIFYITQSPSGSYGLLPTTEGVRPSQAIGWVYFGPYYDKKIAQNVLNEKQDDARKALRMRRMQSMQSASSH